MPVNTEVTNKQWLRYVYCRDNGHEAFVKKADICEAFFRGDQWNPADLAALKKQRRPALTINKIISTISTVLGNQIHNRSEISFRPRTGANPDTADVLAKLLKHVSDDNQLDWVRSDMFCDGIITSRGFVDMRMDYSKSMQGSIKIANLNPKNVVIDPDGEDLDPDTWGDVFTTRWVTADDIAVLYSKTDAEILRNKTESSLPYGFDSLSLNRDRFGTGTVTGYTTGIDESNVRRDLRLLERQFRELDRQKHFVNPKTGDMRPVPEGWDRNRIAMAVQMLGLQVIPRLVRRIKWRVTCDNVLLHEGWSPYKHFTIIPYAPYFRRGHTIGLVENLIGPQELLNKTTSQELHVVNTTANSGYKVKAGTLTTMTVEELEQRGSETGLVVELNEMDGLEKLLPNPTPQGLDRLSFKAEESIKSISNVGDSQLGQDRADVAAKAIQQKRQAGSDSQAKPLDSLVRTDYFVARNALDLIQEFYTEERIITITHDKTTGATTQFSVNQVQPDGSILNDLTVGEYDVVISSVPQRETLEDSQFDQAIAMKEAGIAIPDKFIIDSSRLMNKKDLIAQIAAQTSSPEAQAAAKLQQDQAQAEVDKTKAETGQKTADTHLKEAKTQKEGVSTQKEAATPIEGPQAVDQSKMVKVEADIQLERERFEHEKQLDAEKMKLEREKLQADAARADQAAAEKQVADRVARAAKPKPQPQGASA